MKKLFEILDKWKYQYLTAAAFLVISMGFRMLEPRVLQITVDKIISLFIVRSDAVIAGDDLITRLLYSLLPHIKIENAGIILLSLGAMYIVISLLRSVTGFSSSAISAASTEKAVKKLRDRLFMHLQHLPMDYYSKTPTGELIQRCTGDVETVRKFASMQVVDSVRMSAIFIGAVSMMLMINVYYTLIAVCVFPFVLIGSFFFFRKEGEIWRRHEAEQDKLTAIVQENLSGIRVVKAFAKEKYEIEKFTEQNERKRKWGLKLLKLHSIYWPGSDVMVYLQLAISIFAGAFFVLNNSITVGQYVAFFSYASFVTWPLRRLAQLVSEMGMTSVAIERIYSILNTEKEDYSGFGKTGRGLTGSIEFDNVFFRYPGSNGHCQAGTDHVLNRVSFRIEPGEKIALLGPTGSGKSTIISLLMRFYDPLSGSIRVDGKDISQFSRAYLRNKIGVVLQKPFLFSTSIKENIAYVKPDTHIDEVVQSARIASIHEIITDIFPNAYDTVVGEKGVTLSGGQKQRVTLARTLLKNPDILVMDDSTSSVDTETEFEIQKSLRSITRNKTIIIIAHRITSVQDCDRIIVLDKGRVIEQGSHDELIMNNGFYKKIYDIQVSIEEEIENDMSFINVKPTDAENLPGDLSAEVIY